LIVSWISDELFQAKGTHEAGGTSDECGSWWHDFRVTKLRGTF
jgi:hypothetical protein